MVLEDWDRMTLTGELHIVEGQYDFALGPILRKTFVVTTAASSTWDGDPYQDVLDLDAVYQTRANVQPLLGSAGSGVQNEDIDVILHLDGPMLRPNIGFDLGASNAPTLVAEALSTAVVDESERTSQAIALLSLQEFLPQQFNTLELGSNGLQEYSIDVVTNQLSQWLSRINDDVDIGIRYDANAAIDPTSVNQDALQLALKASFFQNKLEVEGAVGSPDVTQDALGEAQLQNIRVLYNLNDEKSLQLTGFSESQTSATQSANTTSQGVGIRWHRSFNWTWPWRRPTETSTDAIRRPTKRQTEPTLLGAATNNRSANLWPPEGCETPERDVRRKEHPTDAVSQRGDARRNHSRTGHNAFRRFWRHPKRQHLPGRRFQCRRGSRGAPSP